jgi:hypothetical protein
MVHTRAAANPITSRSPSSWRQISVTAVASVPMSKSAAMPRARSTKS